VSSEISTLLLYKPVEGVTELRRDSRFLLSISVNSLKVELLLIRLGEDISLTGLNFLNRLSALKSSLFFEDSVVGVRLIIEVLLLFTSELWESCLKKFCDFSPPRLENSDLSPSEALLGEVTSMNLLVERILSVICFLRSCRKESRLLNMSSVLRV